MGECAHIWVDADACPAVIKEILYRAAERSKIPMTLVANKPLRTPPSRYIRMVQVPRGLDVTDNEIARRLEPGDLVITADCWIAFWPVRRALDGRRRTRALPAVRDTRG